MRTPPRVMPALVTPFTADGELDLESHRHNLRTLAAEGINGFLIAGSTGEGAYLEPGEREELLRTARHELGRRPFLLGGVVAETERAARAQLAEVAAGGADGALVITPTTLVRNRHPLVKRFYTDLADDAPVPLMLYSVPSYTAYPLPTEVAVELSAHPAIVGMKDSGGDPVRMGDLVAGCTDGFFLFCGSSAALSQAVAAGSIRGDHSQRQLRPGSRCRGGQATQARSMAAATDRHEPGNRGPRRARGEGRRRRVRASSRVRSPPAAPGHPAGCRGAGRTSRRGLITGRLLPSPGRYRGDLPMAVKFLSEEWAQSTTDALNSHDGFKSAIGNADLGIQFTVSDTPEGDVNYYLKTGEGAAQLAIGDLEGADVTVTNEYPTAVAIAKGELNTQMAFMQGKLKVGGNLAKLMMHQSAVQQWSNAVAGMDVEY